jgi:hypothetical protein
MENFKQIGKHSYFVGNKGTIRGFKKALSPKTKSNGYKEVQIYINKKPIMKYVHRLVAEYWIGKIPKGYNVNHIDGDKSNNCVENLEIVTPSENSLHSYHVLGNKAPVFQGDKHPMTKLTKEDVSEIRYLYDESILSTNDIHKMFHDLISLSALRKICYRSTWKHI